jgi:hypothetical protein
MITDCSFEDGIYRRPPSGSYISHGNVLEISESVIEATLKAHSLYRQRKLESCCFWYGRKLSDNRKKVEAVVIPSQQNSWGNYSITSDAMAHVSELTRPLGLVNLAQIHTHPGKLVEHSAYDDKMANSRKALSIVLPSYGASGFSWPEDIGIHEFQEGYWYRLSHEQSLLRIAIEKNYGPITLIDARR